MSEFNLLPEIGCGFCLKTSREVKLLFKGACSVICNECLDLCNLVIKKQAEGKELKAGADDAG